MLTSFISDASYPIRPQLSTFHQVLVPGTSPSLGKLRHIEASTVVSYDSLQYDHIHLVLVAVLP
jgi:hypothetical protein